MNPPKYFKTRVMVINPEVIAPVEASPDRFSYVETTAWGKFYRVKPVDQREWSFLAGLEHRKDKFAPKVQNVTDEGEGVLISSAAMAMIDA